MDKRPVFVLLTANGCPGCINFKQNVWPSLKPELEKDGRVQIVEIEVPDTKSKPDPVKYHKDFGRFVGWFPTMSLYPADRWYNHSSELYGIIKNGKIVPPSKNEETGKMIPEHVEPVGKINLSKEDILKWMEFTLTNPSGMFKFPKNAQNEKSSEKSSEKSVLEPIAKTNNGKIMVPTRGYYAKFVKSQVE